MSPRTLSRRQVLRGAGGLALALPYLESLALGQTAAPPTKRFAVFFTVNGVHPNTFFPKAAGALTPTTLTGTALEPLLGLEHKCLVARGINVPGPGGKGHEVGYQVGLTAQPFGSGGGISVDRFLYQRRTVKNRAPLTLGVNGEFCTPITMSGPNMPVTPETSPQRAYAQLVTGLPTGTPPVVDELLRKRKSVLDAVKTDFDALKRKRLSAADKQKLDMHFTALRSLEGGLVAPPSVPMPGCRFDAARAAEINAANANAGFPVVGKMQVDLMAMALACGVHTEATLTWGGCAAEGVTFNWDGIHHSHSHHALSHHQASGAMNGNPVATAPAMLLQIEQWYCRQFRSLADKLNAYTEADGKTVLDHSALVWWNEMGWGLAHSNDDQPVVVAGGAGGYLKQGQFVRTASPRLNSEFWTTLINAMGIREPGGALVSRFGNVGGSGEIADIKA